jgi:hypothetical protein
MRDRNYLTCRQCHSDIHWKELESTIIGFICKECYSDDILRRDLKELERERGIEE